VLTIGKKRLVGKGIDDSEVDPTFFKKMQEHGDERYARELQKKLNREMNLQRGKKSPQEDYFSKSNDR